VGGVPPRTWARSAAIPPAGSSPPADAGPAAAPRAREGGAQSCPLWRAYAKRNIVLVTGLHAQEVPQGLLTIQSAEAQALMPSIRQLRAPTRQLGQGDLLPSPLTRKQPRRASGVLPHRAAAVVLSRWASRAACHTRCLTHVRSSSQPPRQLASHTDGPPKCDNDVPRQTLQFPLHMWRVSVDQTISRRIV